MNAAAKYGAALTSPSIHVSLLPLVASALRPNAFGQVRLAAFDPV